MLKNNNYFCTTCSKTTQVRTCYTRNVVDYIQTLTLFTAKFFKHFRQWILWQNGWTDRDAARQKFYKTANFLLESFFAPGGPGPYWGQGPEASASPASWMIRPCRLESLPKNMLVAGAPPPRGLSRRAIAATQAPYLDIWEGMWGKGRKRDGEDRKEWGNVRKAVEWFINFSSPSSASVCL